MDATATRDTLLAAVGALVGTVPPAAIIPELRRLLHRLTEDEPAPVRAPLARKTIPAATTPSQATPQRRANGTADDADWLELREQVRAAVARQNLDLDGLGAAVGLATTTVTVTLGRRVPPGPKVLARLRAFADLPTAPEVAATPAPFPSGAAVTSRA